MSLEADIEQFLKTNRKTNVRDYIVSKVISQGLVVLGAALGRHHNVASLLADVVKSYAAQKASHTWFHAGEAFHPSDRTSVQNFLAASMTNLLTLDERIRPFYAMLEAVRDMPNPKPVAILAGGDYSFSNTDKVIFETFLNSVTEQKLARTIQGHFLMDLMHAARQDRAGRTAKTAFQLLMQNNPKSWAVRLTVGMPGQAIPPDADTEVVYPRFSYTFTDGVDLLPILDRVAAGTNFYVEIGGSNSPFGDAKLGENQYVKLPYNELYDAIIHLVN